jgi:SWI/SNF-related matrix-associated actin-dependent regulator of chromatin subfamily A-like protein 1
LIQLKPFQLEGAAFLAARTRALLADEPGVGKTGQLVHACDLVGARRVGVVCPDIGITHWRREFRKWSTTERQVDVIAWEDMSRGRAVAPKERWDVLIPDEQHFGKNLEALRTKGVFAKGGLGHYGDRIWCASGTPAPNNVGELWPMLYAFGKTKMGYDEFLRWYCHVDDRGKVRGNREDHIGELRAILKSFSLRRLKKDVLPELGPIDVQEWYVQPRPDFVVGPTLGFAQQEVRLRAQMEGMSAEDLLVFLAGDEEFSTLRRFNALLKAPAVFETVKFELENGLLDKIVIYAYHKEAMAALHNAFAKAGIGSILIYGDTPRGERDGLIERWKKPGGPPVNISSILVAGTVVDYTAAHQVIALECDWVPGNNSQAWQRPHRQGQERSVTVRVAIGTPIDEIVSGVLIRKTKDIDQIFS